MTHLLVIGRPDIDLQFKEPFAWACVDACMGAICSGVDVSLVYPRPATLSYDMDLFSSNLTEWIGPEVQAVHQENFKISLEAYLDFLPVDLSDYESVYIYGMKDAQAQLSVLAACRTRGAKMIALDPCVKRIKGNIDTLKRCLNLSDVFFINQTEGEFLFGPIDAVQLKTGQIGFVRLMDGSTLVIQGDYQTRKRAVPFYSSGADEGDSLFNGAVTANLLLGCHPVFSALKAGALVSVKFDGNYPESLLREPLPPRVALDARVRINAGQVEKCAQVVRTLPEADPFNFVSDFLPPVHHPNVLDYFFAVTLQQFSFWEDDGRKYTKPLIAPINGKRLKGSSYLYQAYTRQLLKDPFFFTPERQAGATQAELLAIFRADDRSDPMPAFDLHLEKTRQYGKDMLALGLTPENILAYVQNSPTPLRTFSMMLNHIGGYKEDPIRKKTDLLAMCLDARPEKLFQFREDEAVLPVVDYHCMRACLRMGLIEIKVPALEKKLTSRALVTEDEEWAVRYAAFLIQEQIIALSGRAVDAVHWFFFNYTRDHCPEMADPVCSDCAMDGMCAHRKEMFQPVFRTTFY
jgi:hypothetical protein